ncbi:MAG: Nif3-like dinuclear metal center hexameric protein [Patescibacteria group bacterium]|nr:Nif3-like dinuclear metal center hexameric protein [Patescibacteria group bacterium]MBU1877303.1 Nif3-like dinuclear metal center hexameric protein [Patescibacteria group bacterium]
MKVQEIYNLAIKLGIEADFRGKEGIERYLQNKKKKYEKLSEKEKEYFDIDALTNPYSDSKILNIAQEKEIEKILVGIDIDPAEILLAKEIGDIDLIIGHHPLGKGLANLSDVMNLQCDVLNQYGIPINIAERLMKERISEVARGINGLNHQRPVDTAKILGFNLMCLHTVCDNLAAKFLKDKIEAANLFRIGDLVDLLREIPEYQKASCFGAGPKIFVGNKDNRCGKIALTELTGGAEGSSKIYEKLAIAGIGTVVGMHMGESNKKEAEVAGLNVVIAGHLSSDSLGVNLFLDELEKQGIKIIPCSGLIRVSRNN